MRFPVRIAVSALVPLLLALPVFAQYKPGTWTDNPNGRPVTETFTDGRVYQNTYDRSHEFPGDDWPVKYGLLAFGKHEYVRETTHARQRARFEYDYANASGGVYRTMVVGEDDKRQLYVLNERGTPVEMHELPTDPPSDLGRIDVAALGPEQLGRLRAAVTHAGGYSSGRRW